MHANEQHFLWFLPSCKKYEQRIACIYQFVRQHRYSKEKMHDESKTRNNTKRSFGLRIFQHKRRGQRIEWEKKLITQKKEWFSALLHPIQQIIHSFRRSVNMTKQTLTYISASNSFRVQNLERVRSINLSIYKFM